MVGRTPRTSDAASSPLDEKVVLFNRPSPIAQFGCHAAEEIGKIGNLSHRMNHCRRARAAAAVTHFSPHCSLNELPPVVEPSDGPTAEMRSRVDIFHIAWHWQTSFYEWKVQYSILKDGVSLVHQVKQNACFRDKVSNQNGNCNKR